MKTKKLSLLILLAVAILSNACAQSSKNIFNSETFSIVELGTPNFNGSYDECSKSNRISLKYVSQVGNDITDDEAWLEKYAMGLKPRTEYAFTPGGNRAPEELKSIVPLTCGNLYRRTIDITEGYNVLYYGERNWDSDFGVNPTLVIVTDPAIENVLYAFDFSNFSVHSYANDEEKEYVDISVGDVEIENDVLYASVSHCTYAKSSAGYNAYLVAIDLKTATVKWISQPLTCNSSFHIYKDVIFSGYGYTNERDYIHIIDKETGCRISSVELSKGPSYLSIIDNMLYVRTYNIDYTFKIVE